MRDGSRSASASHPRGRDRRLRSRRHRFAGDARDHLRPLEGGQRPVDERRVGESDFEEGRPRRPIDQSRELRRPQGASYLKQRRQAAQS